MIGLSNEHSGAHHIWQGAEVPCCLERATEGAEAIDEIGNVHIEVGGIDVQTGEEFTAELIGKLVELDQVAFV